MQIGFLTENYIRVGSELFTGLLIAGIALLFLIFVLLCVLVAKVGKGSSSVEEVAPAAATPAYTPTPAFAGIPGETVAAISAAIAVTMEEEGNAVPFAIKSITPKASAPKAKSVTKRAGRPAWNRAGMYENTRPF